MSVVLNLSTVGCGQIVLSPYRHITEYQYNFGTLTSNIGVQQQKFQI